MLLRTRIVCLGLAVFLSTVVSAFAQAKPAPRPGPYPPPAPPYPRFEATGGYQLLKVPDQTIPFGLNADGAWNGSKALGIVGEIGWVTDSEAGVRVHGWNLGVGPRFNSRPMGGKAWPFAQVLVGVFHARGGGGSDTSFQVQPGGGVSINVGDGWGWVFQGDYRRVFFEGEGENQGRFFTGIRVLLD